MHLSLYRDPADRPAEALLAAWPTLRHHAPAIRRAGVDVMVVHAADHDETVRVDDVDFHWARDPVARVRRLRPDVLHAHGFVRIADLARVAWHVGRRRVLVQDHGGRAPAGFRGRLWRGLLAGMTVSVTARSQAAWLGRRTRVVVIPEASTTMQAGDQAEARARTGMTGDPALLWLGRLDANKDPLCILEAVAQAAEPRPQIALSMAWTEGELEAVVRDRVASDVRLRDRVRLLGRLPPPDVEWWLRGADLLVQASHYEGSGYAIIEALACGTPPLVTDIAPFRALLEGLGMPTVPVGDVGGFAAAMIRGPPVSRAQVRAHFDQYLSWDVLGMAWRDAYARMEPR